MSCSREEIERKRLAALEKRKHKLSTSQFSQSSNQQLFPPPCHASSYFSPSVQPYYSQNGARQAKVSSPHRSNENKPKGSPSANSYNPYSKPDCSKTNNTPPSGSGKVVTGTVYLISEERFEVNPSAFSVPLINVFKSVPSRNYDSRSRLWNFSMDDYEDLMNKVLLLRPDVVLGPLPAYVLKILKEPSVNPESVDLAAIEATLRNKLMPFQQEGVRFGIAKRGRCMIADDMGLGKTFQALAIASYYRENWPLLIVTTSSMRETWQGKIHELLPGVPMMSVVTLSGARDCESVADPLTQVVIVSYKVSTMHADLLRQKKFGVVVIDESHYLKSHKAQCTVALTSITKCARRVVLLSGTPALSRPAELYTQLHIIEPKLFANFIEYGKRYCGGKMTNFGWDMSGQSNLTELQILLQKKFLIRRTKEQVLVDVQDKVRESVMLDPSLMQVSKEEQEGLSQMAQRLTAVKSSEKQAALLTFFSESARVKIPAICKYISQLVRGGEESAKFLVFAHHKEVVDAVCLTLDELRVHYICIVGGTRTDLRASLVDKFQLSESCRCAVLSITAAGSGLTLTAAQLVLFAELHWNPGILTQAEARAHRIGQRGGVRVRYLLAKGTSDDYMWPMLQHKLSVLNEVGLSKDNFDDTACTTQKSSNGIMQYLTSPSGSKNKNDYVPGTNIRKCNIQNTSVTNSSHRQEESEDIDKSFREDEEGDDLLANLEL